MYDVLRVWDRPVSDFLSAPLGLLPLAPLAGVRQPDLAAVVGRMKARIAREAAPPLDTKLWSATYMLMGLRFDEAVINAVLEGVMRMEESVTYQAILRRGRQEGRAEGARAMVLRGGRKKFGPPTAAHEAALNAITDIYRLESLVEKSYDAATWDELLSDG